MQTIRPLTTLFAALIVCSCASTSGPKEAAQTWDDLQLVKSKAGLDYLYVKPGATLAAYRKVMIDPLEVSFDKNWEKKMAEGTAGSRLNTVDSQRIRQELAEEFRKVSQQEIEKEGGFPLVDQPGDDVLRVLPAIINLYINAPDTMTPGRSRTYVVDAGQMTLVAELRDSHTNAVLARVVDHEQGGETGFMQVATSVSNSAEARRIIAKWAGALRNALKNAQAQSAESP